MEKVTKISRNLMNDVIVETDTGNRYKIPKNKMTEDAFHEAVNIDLVQHNGKRIIELFVNIEGEKVDFIRQVRGEQQV